jgi:hypothetical protein
VAVAAAEPVAEAAALGLAVPVGVAVPVAAAVVVADGVAQAPSRFAALLAPNTLPTFGTSSATPTPITTAATPMIAMRRVRDRGSNLRSCLKTLLR